MGDYEACAADCDAAVERGREARADYKIIARALTRKGNALAKLERYEDAVATYHKALTEHRWAPLTFTQKFPLLRALLWCTKSLHPLLTPPKPAPGSCLERR